MLKITIFIYIHFVVSIDYELSNLNNYYCVRYPTRWHHDFSCSELERVARFVGYPPRGKGSWPSIIILDSRPVGMYGMKLRRITSDIIKSGNFIKLQDDWKEVLLRKKENMWDALMV
jgi:hypothetical protein